MSCVCIDFVRFDKIWKDCGASSTKLGSVFAATKEECTNRCLADKDCEYFTHSGCRGCQDDCQLYNTCSDVSSSVDVNIFKKHYGGKQCVINN